MNRRALAIIVLYLLLIPGFAGIYYTLYRGKPTRFHFSGDITPQQQAEREAALDERIQAALHRQEQFTANLVAIAAFQAALSGKSGPIAEKAQRGIVSSKLTLVDGEFKFEFSVHHIDPPEQSKFKPPKNPAFDISRGQTHLFGSLLPSPYDAPVLPSTYEECRHIAESLVAMQHMQLKTATDDERDRRAEKADVQNQGPALWGYWDFLYFSTITQTTVGYGDILPNSTVVRQWVMFQTILGLVIASFALALMSRGS